MAAVTRLYDTCGEQVASTTTHVLQRSSGDERSPSLCTRQRKSCQDLPPSSTITQQSYRYSTRPEQWRRRFDADTPTVMSTASCKPLQSPSKVYEFHHCNNNINGEAEAPKILILARGRHQPQQQHHYTLMRMLISNIPQCKWWINCCLISNCLQHRARACDHDEATHF